MYVKMWEMAGLMGDSKTLPFDTRKESGVRCSLMRDTIHEANPLGSNLKQHLLLSALEEGEGGSGNERWKRRKNHQKLHN